jgi:hypothetical protein
MNGALGPVAPPVLPDDAAGHDQKELLYTVAAYLYESHYGWQSQMARRIRKDPRTVRRWLSGQDAIDPTAWELLRLLVAWKAMTGFAA